jgi:hypothetical protein
MRFIACPHPGQDGAKKFYSRFDKNDAASPPIRLGTLSPDLVVLFASGERVAANAATLASDAPPMAFAALEKSASGAPGLRPRGRSRRPRR